MLQGIILAGGESSRAKVNKLLLKVSNKELISHTIDSMRPFVDKIIVVTGKYHDQLLPFLKDVEVVRNNDYIKGMFSSVQAGVGLVEGDFLIIPGDIGFVKEETYRALINKGVKTGEVLRPTYKGKSGHPMLVSSSLKRGILKEPVESNLRDFISKRKIKEIEVDDEFINVDIDTLEEYEDVKNKLERN